ncbi:MAG: substrate-binding domain-containing protein [Planctomycetota bacterium]
MTPTPVRTIVVPTAGGLHYSRQVSLGVKRFLQAVPDAPPMAMIEAGKLAHPQWRQRLPGQWAAVGYAGGDDLADARRLKMPCVFCNTSLEGEFARVVPDHPAVGRLAGEHLVAQGHRRVGFVTYYGITHWEARKQGLAAALGEVGGTVRDVFWSGDATDELGEALAGLSAVMLPTDQSACQFLRIAGQLGIVVPDELAVIGADNDTFACEMAEVPLSSVDLAPRRIGELAAEVLWDALKEGRMPESAVLRVPPRGVAVRRSTDVLAYEDPHVRSAMAFIQEHACEDITIEDVVRDQTISRRTLENRFKRDVGRTLLKQIHHARFENAKRLLIETGLRITDIAPQCGYPDHSRFTTEFGKHVGMSPSAYRAVNGLGD